MRIDELRQLIFARDVAVCVTRHLEIIETEDFMQDNTLGQLNVELFGELHRLREVDMGNPDALKSEIERSKAVEGLAHTIIDNAKTILDATRMRASLTNDVSVPRLLEG